MPLGHYSALKPRQLCDITRELLWYRFDQVNRPPLRCSWASSTRPCPCSWRFRMRFSLVSAYPTIQTLSDLWKFGSMVPKFSSSMIVTSEHAAELKTEDKIKRQRPLEKSLGHQPVGRTQPRKRTMEGESDSPGPHILIDRQSVFWNFFADSAMNLEVLKPRFFR